MTERRARGFSNITSMGNSGSTGVAREFKPKPDATSSGGSSINKRASEAAAVSISLFNRYPSSHRHFFQSDNVALVSNIQ